MTQEAVSDVPVRNHTDVARRRCRVPNVAIEPFEQRQLLSLEPVGSEFRVNTFTLERQSDVALAMDVEGNFVVVWLSLHQDGSSSGIFGQRYSSAGVPQDAEFQVNTYTAERQNAPEVAMDADGDFVVTWQSYGQDGSSDGIYAQRFDSSGLPQGAEFRVNTYTTGS